MTEQLNNNTWNYQYLDYFQDPKKSMRKPKKKQRKYVNKKALLGKYDWSINTYEKMCSICL